MGAEPVLRWERERSHPNYWYGAKPGHRGVGGVGLVTRLPNTRTRGWIWATAIYQSGTTMLPARQFPTLKQAKEYVETALVEIALAHG